MILRSQLIVLLQNKIFNEYSEFWEKDLSIKMFRNEYPRYPTIESINVTEEEKTYTIDLRPFMNPSPYTLKHVSVYNKTCTFVGNYHIIITCNSSLSLLTVSDVAKGIQVVPRAGPAAPAGRQRHERGDRNDNAQGRGEIPYLAAPGPHGSRRALDHE